MMVRPFFKWIVSADAATEASMSILANRVVTRSRIEAHSSNSEGTHPRHESTANPMQGGHDAGRMPGILAVSGVLECAGSSGADRSCARAPAWTGGVPLSATQ